MKSSIIFNGMNRQASPEIAKPGDCSAIINLRNQSGHLVPVGKPELLYTLSQKGSRLLYVHTCYDGEHHITTDDLAIYYEALVYKETEKIAPQSKELFALNGQKVIGVQSIGNTLIVICAENTYYLLYKESRYIFLGERPEIPEISFSIHPMKTDAYHLEEHNFHDVYVNPKRLELVDADYYSLEYYNAFFELQDRAWERHYFIQPILVRYAITLYDGSRIYSSVPVMLSQPDPIQPYKVELRINNSNGNNVCIGTHAGDIVVNNYCIRYFIHKMNLENWKDIVRSIDIFVTPEATIFEPDAKREGFVFDIERTEANETVTFSLKGEITFLDREEVKKRYLQSPLFYKITSIENWDELKDGQWYDIENKVRTDLLVHEEPLSPDNTTLLSTGAQISYVHNQRLHLANLNKKLFTGFTLSLFDTGEKGTESVLAYISTYLKTERGESMVVWYGELENFSNQLSPFLSYPDSNAYKMEIVVKSPTARYKGSFLLTPSEYENRSDYLDVSLSSITLPNDSVDASTPLQVPKPVNDVYTQENILRVSKADNPFVFPAEQTYSVSNGAITGIASITTALSEGQFGEFPLYLFTEEGIWALQNGTESVCYSAQHQLSREPIAKGYPIIPLEDTIAFATPKGLSILQGATVQQILSFDEMPYENNKYVLNQISASNVLKAAYDLTPLSEFIPQSMVAYNPIEKELIFGHSKFPYTIVLHLPTLYMYRTTQVYTSFLYDSTHLLGQDIQNGIYNLQKENHDTPTQVALLTRPISLQSGSYQRWKELTLRVAAQGQILYLSLWGGNEAENLFNLVGLLSSAGNVPGRLTLQAIGPAYKFYRIVFSGEASTDLHLWAADVLVEFINYNNQLR